MLISGQSIIIGEIEATTEHEEATIIADIVYSRIEERRMNMPFAKQRHGDLYQFVDISRAVDNQVYVATCSPARDINAGYVAWATQLLFRRLETWYMCNHRFFNHNAVMKFQ